MSRWRKNGFVQDSDDEEESQIESQACQQYAGTYPRDEYNEEAEEAEESWRRDEEASSHKDVRPVHESPNILERPRGDEEHIMTTPTKRIIVQRPTPSPLTPKPIPCTEFEEALSPDALQISSSPAAKRKVEDVSSQLLGSPLVPKDVVSLDTQRDVAVSSQVLGEPISELQGVASERPLKPTAEVLSEFGIAPLSDDSDDNTLSDPPSDLESPVGRLAFVEPHRRTAVQVVIPSSTALQQHLVEQAPGRELRQRKPIQLHPYALEGELYRREVQSRGLKPVARVRSPALPQIGNDEESQEKEFEPDQVPSSSPPELDIAMSTPLASPSDLQTLQGDAGRRPSLWSDGIHPSEQLYLPPAGNKRRPNFPSTKSTLGVTSTFEHASRERNIRSIQPQSPPYSSSPPLPNNGGTHRMDHRSLATPAPNLPTPSTSSVFRDGTHLPRDEDSDSVPRIAPRSNGDLHRPTKTVPSDSSSSSSEASSEPDDFELRKVSRKIKGVLPASWLRFDKQIQERRKPQEGGRVLLRKNAVEFPSPAENQKGVAQRVARPIGRPRAQPHLHTSSNDILVISDDSDKDSTLSESHQSCNIGTVAKATSTFAAISDDRFADGNLSDMEDDQLHLPTLRGGSSKRKRQPKITDTLGGVKRTKLGGKLTKTPCTKKRNLCTSLKKMPKQFSTVRNNRLPAVSIIDTNSLPAQHSGVVPQFLRVARRQALRRPDLARQNLNAKQIRLHNAQDTEEANDTLRDWRKGNVKPNVAPDYYIARQPISQRENTRQTPQQEVMYRSATADLHEKAQSVINVSQAQKHNRLPRGLQIFTRSCSPVLLSSQSNRNQSGDSWKKSYADSVPYRSAQLEGNEGDFDYEHRRTAFEEGLRQADQLSIDPVPQARYHMNTQLARYLSNAEPTPHSLPIVARTGGHKVETPTKQTHHPRKQLVRKFHAQRIDVDTREYRQPSEPAVQEILAISEPQPRNAVDEDVASRLYGLGLHGTRYPITFDVFSLTSGTYFHSTTFVGSDEFRRALNICKPGTRNFDESAGHYIFTYGATFERFGAWDDETSSKLQDLASVIFMPLEHHSSNFEHPITTFGDVLGRCTQFLRAVIGYISDKLCFLDPIDRKSYVERMIQMIESLFSSLLTAQERIRQVEGARNIQWHGARVMAYLLLLITQTYWIAQHPTINADRQSLSSAMISNISKALVKELVQEGIPELGAFLEQNKRHKIRESGIQSSDAIVECTVLCMKILDSVNLPGCGFWDFVSAELSPTVAKANDIFCFETTWATVVTLLPFGEFDASGIPTRSREGVQGENWGCLRDLLKRLFELYSTNSGMHNPSFNEYVRTNLARCHRMIKYWHWERPELMLNATFDFFGKNGLRQLRHEGLKGSVPFLDNLGTEQSLGLEANETAFHIALKCLALGLQGMSRSYTEKKIRSFVFRTIPNHGRAYPKDQSLGEESLAALRNHHDLLSVLYWAAPTQCRPKLHHIRDLVNHETSHREACRLNVRAWANLTLFQLSTDEPYAVAQPFALWFKDIMRQSLNQYRLAKSEADDYLKSRVIEGTSNVSAVMVRQTMEKNQEQVIATLRDCILGMRKAIQSTKDPGNLLVFLCDCDVVYLLELPHLEDHRLVQVIRDALNIFRDFSTMQIAMPRKYDTQTTGEESQDYGEFPDLDECRDHSNNTLSDTGTGFGFDIIQSALWRLLSNAFGAETAPDDSLLMDCVDTWVCAARAQVTSGQRTWSYYIDSYSQFSWTQLRQTEQTRKFAPYFMAALIDIDPKAYKEHQQELIQAMLLSLVERESMLRFQHRLLAAILRVDHHHPLLQNLPYIRNQDTNGSDVTAETLRNRRLALISSILSNMRDDVQASTQGDCAQTTQKKQSYATTLRDFMATMKFNYQQLQQETTVIGAYVEFVQKIVQFLKQHTNDICPVLPFFTDSSAFPLPADDPSYVLARLCGYAPKLAEPGIAKQLSVFIQNVSQQAAASNQQPYLVNQLTKALCTEEASTADREMLRSILLQDIFPAYLEEAFTSSIGLLLAQPLLGSLPTILESMVFDLRVMQPASLSAITNSILAISHAFIRGFEHTKGDPYIFHQPHILSTLAHMIKAMASTLPLLDYLCSRTSTSRIIEKPIIIDYIEKFNIFIIDMLQDEIPMVVPEYEGNAYAPFSTDASNELLRFCKRELQETIRTQWSGTQGSIWFGQGQSKREVSFEIGNVEEERAHLEGCIEDFERVVHRIYGYEHQGVEEMELVINDVIV